MAERGVDGVSLNEINKAAGQKNTSALHYHFGDRAGLINAIIDQHTDELRQELVVRLDALEAAGSGSISPRAFVECYLKPYADKLNQPRGKFYLQIMAELLAKDPERAVLPRSTLATTDLRERIHALLAGTLTRVTQVDVNMRSLAFGLLLFTSLAAYSRMDPPKARKMYGGKRAFLARLSELLEAVIEPG